MNSSEIYQESQVFNCLLFSVFISFLLSFQFLCPEIAKVRFVGQIQTVACFYTVLELIIGEGNGTPLQDSCLENPMDRGAWGAAVYGVAQSWT